MTKVMRIQPSKIKSSCSIPIAGYRHASNLILAASIVLPETTTKITNLPHLVDTTVMIDILSWLGVDISNREKNAVCINTQNLIARNMAEQPLSAKMHGSIYLVPALLARFGHVNFGKSGGCQIGASIEGGERPVNHIVEVMKAFGADVNLTPAGGIEASAKKLTAATIDIADFSFEKDKISGPLTSGATKAAIILSLAVPQGKTVLLNPFLKSETINLIEYIKSLGFKVSYDKARLEIEPALLHSEVTHQVISDPSEIITYISLAVYHQVRLNLTHITMQQTARILAPELALLKKIGVNFLISGTTLSVGLSKQINACDVEITPEFVCTDHHPFILLILLMANGKSHITENVWHERFQYIPELAKFEIEIKKTNNSVEIKPQLPAIAKEVILGRDLRAAALLVLLALKAPGETVITNFYHLYRGYEDFFDKLASLGASIQVEEMVYAG